MQSTLLKVCLFDLRREERARIRRAMGRDDLAMLMLITDQAEADTDGALAAPL